MLDELDHPFVRQIVEKAGYVCIENPVRLLPHDPHPKRIQRIMLASPRPEPIGEPQEVLFVNLVEDRYDRLLNDLILQGWHDQSKLHWSTTHIWDGLRSAIPTTHFGASSFEY